jgi:hypothetical protein
MRKFSDFIKEEIDLRGNRGIPDDFMRNSEEEAGRNLGIRIDDERQMGTIWPQFQQLMNQSMQLMMQGPDGRPLGREQMQSRLDALQNLAKDVIMDEYGEILESSTKPVELDIRLVNPNEVIRQISDLRDVPQNARPPRADDTHEEDEEEDQTEQDQQDDDCVDGSCSSVEGAEENTEEPEDITGNVLTASLKKKILNMLTQGEGKATKDIIKFSPLVENGLQQIFGANGGRILRIWSDMSDTADKMDWVIPVANKAAMMSNNPAGMAGATDVTWESVNNSIFSIELLKENQNFNKITIKAVGVDFPMLIHETVKGIYLLIQSAAIKKDKEFAKKVKAATSSFMDEAQDFRYGVPAQAMFNDFINACKDSQKYKQMRTRIFRLLANDKDKLTAKAIEISKTDKDLGAIIKKDADLALSDNKFLEVFNSLFSVFDKKMEAGKLLFFINTERFNQSEAKKVIEKLIAHVVETEEDYERSLREWEMEQRFGPKTNYDEPEVPEMTGDDEQGGEDTLIQPVEDDGVYSDEDLSKMRQKDIQELVDDALDKGEYTEVERLSKFLKEGAEIYLKEIERINENRHTRR